MNWKKFVMRCDINTILGSHGKGTCLVYALGVPIKVFVIGCQFLEPSET
jgi:hypothetical protein